MTFDTAVFDMDGTVLDTLDDLTDSTYFALREMGFSLRSKDEVRSFVGNGIRLLIERAVPENTPIEEVDKCFEIFKAHYNAHSLDKTKPYDDIVDVLKELKRRNIKTAVVSNKIDCAVKELCETFFDGLFDCCVGEREGLKRKPAPDSVFAALDEIGAKKDGAVYIGDSEVDIATAKNSGLPCISVLWGFRSKELIQSLSPEYIIDKPTDILEFFKR